jgi:hypothetical protein
MLNLAKGVERYGRKTNIQWWLNYIKKYKGKVHESGKRVLTINRKYTFHLQYHPLL